MTEGIPIDEVMRRAGGADKVAQAIGVDRTTPYDWKRVPPRHVVRVAQLIQVKPSDLRPDIFPNEDAA